MQKELIRLANHLDRVGLTKEADYLDIIIKEAQEASLVEKMNKAMAEACSHIGLDCSDTSFYRDVYEGFSKANSSYNAMFFPLFSYIGIIKAKHPALYAMRKAYANIPASRGFINGVHSAVQEKKASIEQIIEKIKSMPQKEFQAYEEQQMQDYSGVGSMDTEEPKMEWRESEY